MHTDTLLRHTVSCSAVSFEVLRHTLCGDLLSTACVHRPEVQNSDGSPGVSPLGVVRCFSDHYMGLNNYLLMDCGQDRTFLTHTLPIPSFTFFYPLSLPETIFLARNLHIRKLLSIFLLGSQTKMLIWSGSHPLKCPGSLFSHKDSCAVSGDDPDSATPQ